MAGQYDDLIQQAYAGIGRGGMGEGVSQIDPEGFNYWQGQLQSGALNPQNFQQAFTGAVQGALGQASTANTPQYQYIQDYLSGNLPAAPVQPTEPAVQPDSISSPVSPLQAISQPAPQSTYGSEGAIGALYQSALGRQADPEGLRYWAERFGQSISPEERATWLSVAKPGGGISGDSITALGDSTTWGYNMGNQVGQNMTDTAQSILSQDLGRNININNMGVNGSSLGDAISRGDIQKALGDNSSTVLLNYGMNEAYRGVDPNEFRQQLMNAVQQLHAAGKDVVLQTPNYTEGIAGVNNYASIIRDVAAQTGSTLHDKWDETQSLYGQYDPNDPVHPTQQVYQYLGNSLANLLRNKYRG